MPSELPNPRVAAALADLADAIDADLSGAAGSLRAGVALLRAVEAKAGGLNGLSAMLRGCANAIELEAAKLDEESADQRARLVVGARRPAIRIGPVEPLRWSDNET
jgi:hypothetical protein